MDNFLRRIGLTWANLKPDKVQLEFMITVLFLQISHLTAFVAGGILIIIVIALSS